MGLLCVAHNFPLANMHLLRLLAAVFLLAVAIVQAATSAAASHILVPSETLANELMGKLKARDFTFFSPLAEH